MAKHYAWLLLILLAAAALRLVDLNDIPPGLTHDEADHGLDAWGVVNGIRPLYFTVGFGREPLYDYATAGLMAFLGPSHLAGRLTSAYLSLIMIAGAMAWTRRAFGERTALLTAAGLAVSFWAVMTGRQALRSITLPTIFTLATYFYWRGLELTRIRPGPAYTRQLFWSSPGRWLGARPLAWFIVAGLLLGATVYTYFPSRVIWSIYPLMLILPAIFDRTWFKRLGTGTLLMLLVTAIIALPLIAFLGNNPAAESRYQELNTPLTAAARGDFTPLLKNALAGLQVITFKGDGLERYNIPGRPLLSPLMAGLFFVGLALALWSIIAVFRDRTRLKSSVAHMFAMLWLLIGLSPALVTGPDLSTTRVIAILPVLYVFPALALKAGLDLPFIPRRLGQILLVLLFSALFVLTARDYFTNWANDPEVRVQYESTLVSTVHYLNEHEYISAAISTTTPGPFHSPAVATLTLNDSETALRWFNGLHSLLLPQGSGIPVIFSGFAPLNDFLSPYFVAEAVDTIPTRSTDLDRPLTVYRFDYQAQLSRMEPWFLQATEAPIATLPVHFGQAAELLGYDLQTPLIKPGDTVRLATLWRVNQAAEQAVLFTHLLGEDGQPLVQADRLDVPAEYWQAGDIFIQLHQFPIPESTAPGNYPLVVGIYGRANMERWQVMREDGTTLGDSVRLPSLEVVP